MQQNSIIAQGHITEAGNFTGKTLTGLRVFVGVNDLVNLPADAFKEGSVTRRSADGKSTEFKTKVLAHPIFAVVEKDQEFTDKDGNAAKRNAGLIVFNSKKELVDAFVAEATIGADVINAAAAKSLGADLSTLVKDAAF